MSKRSFGLTGIKAFYFLVIFSVILVSLAMTYGYFANNLLREKVNRMYKLSSGQDFKGRINMKSSKYFNREAHKRDKFIEMERRFNEKVTHFPEPVKRTWADKKKINLLSPSRRNKTNIFLTSRIKKNNTGKSFAFPSNKDKKRPPKISSKFEKQNRWNVERLPSQFKRNNTRKSFAFPTKASYMKKSRKLPLNFGKQNNIQKVKKFPSQFKGNNTGKSAFPSKVNYNMKKSQKLPLIFRGQNKMQKDKRFPSQFKRNNIGKSLAFPTKASYNMKKSQKLPLNFGELNNIQKVKRLPSQFKRNNTRKSLAFPSEVNFNMKKSQKLPQIFGGQNNIQEDKRFPSPFKKLPLKFGELKKVKTFPSHLKRNNTGKLLAFPSKVNYNMKKPQKSPLKFEDI